MRKVMILALLTSGAAYMACTQTVDDRDNDGSGNNNNNNARDAGPGGGDGGGGGGGEIPEGCPAEAQVLTVAQAATSTGVRAVVIHNAVVIAEYHYASGGGTVGTFFIQDNNVGGRGLAVYHSKTDQSYYPSAVGEIVTVCGHLGRYNGMLEISTSSSQGHTLQIVKTGENGVVPAASGALPPVGNPLAVGATEAFSGDKYDNHPELIGNVIKFDGPLTVLDDKALRYTKPGDGGWNPAGFSVTGGLLVNDNMVYYNCIKNREGGVASMTFPNGIQGVWDRYQDFYAGSWDAGSPVQPVLIPMSCDDLLQPAK